VTPVDAARRLFWETPEESLLQAVPGIMSIAGLLVILFYVSGVMATGLFGERFPQWFGSIGESMYSLFQIMTLESWSMGIVRPVMEEHPWAWAFFIPFIVIATFTILNLFIGIIVSTMQELSHLPDPTSRQRDIMAVLQKLDANLKELRSQVTQASSPAAQPRGFDSAPE